MRAGINSEDSAVETVVNVGTDMGEPYGGSKRQPARLRWFDASG